MRDGPEGEIPINIDYVDKIVSIAAAGEVTEISDEDPVNPKKQEETEKKRPAGFSDKEVLRRVRLEFQANPAGQYSLRSMRETIGCRMAAIQDSISALIDEDLIEKVGRRWRLKPEEKRIPVLIVKKVQGLLDAGISISSNLNETEEKKEGEK
jgi:hypothetical protein